MGNKQTHSYTPDDRHNASHICKDDGCTADYLYKDTGFCFMHALKHDKKLMEEYRETVRITKEKQDVLLIQYVSSIMPMSDRPCEAEGCLATFLYKETGFCFMHALKRDKKLMEEYREMLRISKEKQDALLMQYVTSITK